jgi:hypothetical protein
MGRKTRGVVMVVTALAAAGSILWMQGRYESSDKRHALEIVQSYHPRGGTDIPALLERRHPGKPVEWSTAVENSCFQHIRVHAVVTDDPAADPVLYAFVVDINGPSIHPANENGKELIAALDEPLPPLPSASASSSPSTQSAGPDASSAPSSAASGAPSTTTP